MRAGRGRQMVVGAGLLLVVVLVVSAGVGAVPMPPLQVVRILLSRVPGLSVTQTWPDTHATILFAVRLPRVVMGALAGIGLALAGSAYQGLFKNPLADPYMLGVSPGSALGATIAIVFLGSVKLEAIGVVPLFAFVGGLLALTLVYQLARVGHQVPILALLLSGVAVGSVCMALVSLLIYIAKPLERDTIIFWMVGSLGGANWVKVGYILPYLTLGTGLLFWLGRDLNAMLLGEESAHHLGVDVEWVKRFTLVGGALLTGAVVAFCGAIGFIGMIVPHIARMLVGPDHRMLMPTAALLGATILVGTDTIARSLLGGGELPVGIVMSLIGGPFFLWMLKRKFRLAA